VQTRQGFYNKNTNLITRFAAYVLMLYHTIVMPINNKINCVFFCGTAGAIRRSMFEEVGGWNLNSLTEDSELTVNLLLKGYKSVYLDIETLSEVPETFEGFIKQQMRWCYGNARVFLDNTLKIISKKGLTIKQRLMIIYITLGNIIAPVVIVMTLFGFLGWFLGDLTLINFGDIVELVTRVALTGGFLVIGFLTLYKRKLLKEFPYMVLALFTMGIVLAAANSIAFIKAVTNKKLHWYCTPKIENDKFA
jgi:cellulose synthase/poly-beta-1,6-N-acetylglucosamine synthase-like glycosyltransferase